MKTITLYMSRLFITRFALILLGVTAMVLTLDLVTYGEEINASQSDNPYALLTYAMLSIPGTVSKFYSLVVLIAILLALTELSRHNELVVIWSAGASQAQIFMALAPLAVILGLGHFLIDDQLAPRTSAALIEWGVGKFSSARYQRDLDAPVWMKSGDDIVRAGQRDENADVLKDIIIFRRAKDGLLTEQIEAERAQRQNDHWQLQHVRIYSGEDGSVISMPDMVYYGSLRSAVTGREKGDPTEMSLSQLFYFSQNAGFGVRPGYVYETWAHKRLTTMLTGLMALLIAVPIAHSFRRGGGFGVLFLFGIAIGFGYFIYTGVTLALGQGGILPPILAGWLAPLTLLTVSGMVALQFEAS